jgi:hypothetical protein
MDNVTGLIDIRIKANLNYGYYHDHPDGTVAGTIRLYQLLTNGVNVGQIDVAWSKRQSVGASSNDDLFLTNTLTTQDGQVATFVKVVMVCVYNRSSTPANIIRVGPSAVNGWSPIFDSPTGYANVTGNGMFLWYSPSGFDVQAGVEDRLRIANTVASPVEYDIVLLGKSS